MNHGQYNTLLFNASIAGRYKDVRALSGATSACRSATVRAVRVALASLAVAALMGMFLFRLAVIAVAGSVSLVVRKVIAQGLAAVCASATRTTRAIRGAANATVARAWQLPRSLAVRRLAVSMVMLGLVERYKAMILSPAIAVAQASRTSLVSIVTLSIASAGGVAAWATRTTLAVRAALASTLSRRVALVRSIRRALATGKSNAASVIDRWIATVKPTVVRLVSVVTRIWTTQQKTIVVRRDKPAVRIVNEREK